MVAILARNCGKNVVNNILLKIVFETSFCYVSEREYPEKYNFIDHKQHMQQRELLLWRSSLCILHYHLNLTEMKYIILKK